MISKIKHIFSIQNTQKSFPVFEWHNPAQTLPVTPSKPPLFFPEVGWYSGSRMWVVPGPELRW
jgi:hypothetical protein